MAKPRKFPVAFQNFFIYKKIVSTCVLNSRECNLSLVIDPRLANERNHATEQSFLVPFRCIIVYLVPFRHCFYILHMGIVMATVKMMSSLYIHTLCWDHIVVDTFSLKSCWLNPFIQNIIPLKCNCAPSRCLANIISR